MQTIANNQSKETRASNLNVRIPKVAPSPAGPEAGPEAELREA
jgi:hypothetical protein